MNIKLHPYIMNFKPKFGNVFYVKFVFKLIFVIGK